MTYFRFHWIFNFPLLLVLFLTGWRGFWYHGTVSAMGWVILAAVIFTTPWDNHAVRRGIWGFPPNKYTFRIGHLPVEEYLFFVLQTAIICVAIHVLFFLHHAWHAKVDTRPNAWTWICLAGAVPAFIAIGVELCKWARKTGPRVNYAVHLLWFVPVIYAQWIFGVALFCAHWQLLALVTACFGVYYTIADLIAVRCGLWFFDDKQVTGWKLAGILPWEEIAFFFVTSLVVAQSYLLLLPFYQR